MENQNKKIHCSLERNGFEGYFFEGNKGKDVAVIFMGGAGCNEKVCIESSVFLREAGYAVLVLGFYFWKGLPKEMYHIPVEYAERAAKWLHKKGYSRVIIMGTSTGAGYAMLSASLIQDINGAILVSPLDHVMEAMKNYIDGQGYSMYEYRGKTMPYAHFPLTDHGILDGIKKFKKSKAYPKMTHIMRYSYDTAEYSEESRIKVENIKGDILMIAPREDDCWPSTEAVARMKTILEECAFPYRYEATIYEKGSHALGYWKLTPFLKAILKLLCPIEGKFPEECEKARHDSVDEILKFLDTLK